MSPESIAAVTPLLSDVVKILGPAIIAAVVSYRIAKTQIDAKVSEARAAAELKGRESLFGYYRERGQQLRDASGKLGQELGRLYALVGTTESAADEADVRLTSKLISIGTNIIPLQISLALTDLETAGLGDSAEVARLKELRNKPTWGQLASSRGECLEAMEGAMEVYLFMDHCNQRALEARLQGLFEPYLKPNKTA